MSVTPKRSPGGDAFHIPSLDGMRAIAWAIVFFSHVGARSIVPGGFGVTIFFFLSGFLITTLMRMEDEAQGNVSLKQFYLRRVLRILPPMYLSLLFALILSLLLRTPLDGRAVALQGLHFTNYHVAFDGHGRAIGTDVLWSLSVEEHFYLLFPLGYLALRRAIPKPTHQAAVLFALCWFFLLWRIVLVVVVRVRPDYTTYATDSRMDSILFGCVLALWRTPPLPGKQLSTRVIWSSLIVSLVVLLATILVRNAVFRETARYTFQGLALMPIFIAVVRFADRWPFVLLNTPIVRWFGTLSYGLYLVHLPIISALRGLIHSEALLTIVSFALSVLVATSMYYAVERPCARLRKKLSRMTRDGPANVTTELARTASARDPHAPRV